MNLICNAPMQLRKQAPVKRYSSTKCRMDGSLLRRTRLKLSIVKPDLTCLVGLRYECPPNFTGGTNNYSGQ